MAEPMIGIPLTTAWAAWLLAPISGIEPPLPARPARLQDVLGHLRRDKVPLLWLRGDQRAEAAWLWRWDGWEVALREEEARWRAQREAFARVAEAWAEEGIRPVLIKSLGPSPAFPYTSDNVDALVPPERVVDARAALRRLGYVELRHLEEPNKYLFKRFHAGREVSAIHVHGQVEWHVPFLDAERVLADAEQAEDDALVWAPHPSDGLAVVLAHALYENKEVRLVDLARAGWAIRQPGFDWGRLFTTAERMGWLDGLAGMLWLWDALARALSGRSLLPEEISAAARSVVPHAFARGMLDVLCRPLAFPVPIPFLLSKRLFFARMRRSPGRTRRERWRDILSHAIYGTRRRLGIRSQPAALFAISGIDGSGKTTQAAALHDALVQCGVRADRIWSRPGSSALVAGASRVARRVLRSPAVHNGLATQEIARAERFRRPWVRRLWPWVVALDLSLTIVMRIWPRLWLGRVVVADRYLLDALADLAARLETTEVWSHPAMRVAGRLAPRPRIAFLLMLDPEVARARQGDRAWLPLLRRQAEAYRRLAEMEAVQVLDAARPWEIVSDELVYRALTTYFDAFWTRWNVILWSNPRPLPAALRQITPAWDRG